MATFLLIYWNSLVFRIHSFTQKVLAGCLLQERCKQGTDPVSSLLEASTLGNSRSPAPLHRDRAEKWRYPWGLKHTDGNTSSVFWDMGGTSLFSLRYRQGWCLKHQSFKITAVNAVWEGVIWSLFCSGLRLAATYQRLGFSTAMSGACSLAH